MKTARRFLYINILISALIGVVVGLLEIALPHFDSDSWVIIGTNGLIGILIGQCIKTFSVLSHGRIKLVYSFIISAIILASIGMIIPITRHLLYGSPIFSTYFMVMILAAEVLGMSWTYFSHQYYKGINDQLKRRQSEFQ